ncbi:hypothetical protein RUM43_008362 [Polyplax serrata]|uniref:Rho GTPase-activating protein 39 n=1 Tax=Polyplax serrata TaxID=468196 RepID=A0AAN8PAJ9_POLSC
MNFLCYQMEWVEIIEPRTKEHMYANLTTGECVWDPPPGVPVKKTDDNQWWELFDQNTSRFYYYNAISQKTVWHRPNNCDIIPLAKLQTLKQNTQPEGEDCSEESKSKESVSTQTPGKCVRPPKPLLNYHVKDSGRSSDSSSRTSLDNQKVLESPGHNRYQGTSLPISTSTPIIDKKPLQEINAQSYRSDSNNTYRSSNSGNTTPSQIVISCLKPRSNIAKQKSFDVETSLGIGGCYSNYGHENFRGRAKPEKVGQTPKEVASVGIGSDLSRSYSFVQRRDTSHDEEDSMHEKYFLPTSQSGMRSVESTPQARRKQTFPPSSKSTKDLELIMSTPSRSRRSHKTMECNRSRRYSEENESRTGSSDNETSNTSHSPVTESPSGSISSSRKASRVNHTNTFSNVEPPPCRHSGQISIESTTTGFEETKENQRRSQTKESSGDTFKKQISRDYMEQKEHLKKRNYGESRETHMKGEKYKEKYDNRHTDSSETFKENGNHSSMPNHHKFYSMERSYEKSNSTPLYTNVDYQPYNSEIKNQSHLFPLQQYILEQAKLSGCYKFGDPLNDEMDSLHSEDEASVGRAEYDSDEFADDEGMSNQGDSSSQEYLDDPNYFEQEEFLKKYHKFPQEYKTDMEYIDSLESRMAVNSASQGVYYSGVAPTAYPPRVPSSIVPQNQTAETQHASLKRKKDEPTPPMSSLYSPVIEKIENTNRPVSLPSQTMPKDFTDPPESPRLSLSRDKKLPSESDIEEYAQGHLNIHKKGIFRKKFSVRDMLSWSKDAIRKPMLVLADKALKKDACELFKLVQIYMSDRKAKIGMTLNSVALEICNLGYSKPFLRDELYIQICRQTTENPRRESLRRGWELMAICLNFFPPSAKFQTYLEGYMNRHRDPGFDFPEVIKWPIHVQISHYATVSCKRLERIGTNGKKPPRKPTIEEIDQSRLQIFRASMFGSTLEEVMYLQKERFPNRRLPWVQTVLSEEVLRLQGAQTEGIFRVSADVDEVNLLKTKIDHWDVPTEAIDAHAPASLLKLWYRELYEPLIPDSLYSDCVTHHDDPELALAIVQRLPNINKLVLCYLVRFLQIFSRDEVVQVTKMDASNLATVMAPNCLRFVGHVLYGRGLLKAGKELSIFLCPKESIEQAVGSRNRNK